MKGLLGTKLGMTQLWDENNRVVPVTVIQAGPCVVTQVRTPDADGYSAVQLGFGAIKAKQVTKPDAGHFAKADVTPRKHLVEIRTSDASEYTLGQELTAEVFEAGRGRRRHRCEQGQGHRRCDEAARLPRSAGQPRCAPQAPLAGLHRRLRDPRPGVQGPPDGRPDGRRAGHRAEPDRAQPSTPSAA